MTIDSLGSSISQFGKAPGRRLRSSVRLPHTQMWLIGVARLPPARDLIDADVVLAEPE
jgi:hypothetical protein